MRTIVYTLLGLFASNAAIAAEITPTQTMLARAQQLNKIEHENEGSISFKYHFRKIGDNILWCSYAEGGNGHFCMKVNRSTVAKTDRGAADYCKTANADEDTPPHFIYGELRDLDYKCRDGRMSRLPVDIALDGEGYVRSQWKPLP